MTFTLYVPPAAARIQPGGAVLNKDGMFRANVLDFKAVNINGFCTILVDRDLRRIAMRSVVPKDPAVRVRTRKGGGTGSVDLRGPLTMIGLQPAKDKDAPPFEYEVNAEKQFLVLNFGPLPPKQTRKEGTS